MDMEKPWEARSLPPVAPSVRRARAASNAQARSVSISGELDEENYRAYVTYSDKEYRFGVPEATGDDHNLDLTLTKGLSYPYPVYTHTCSNRYILRRTLSDIRKIPAKTCILSVVLNGHLNIRQSGRVTTMKSHQVTLIDLTKPYMIEIFPPNGADFKSIFTYLPISMISTDVYPYIPYVLEMNSGEVSAISKMLHTLFNLGCSLKYSSSKSIFDAIIFQINNENLLKSNKNTGILGNIYSGDDRWHEVISYLNLMYSNNLLDTAWLSQKVGISQRSLNYVFSQHGTTFSKMLWDLRLSVVRDWLSDPLMGEVAIQQIAADAGFKSAAHLSTFFKSRMGCSPREFRRRRLGEC